MKKRRRAYKKYDWKTHKLINEVLNRTYYPFSEFFNWYAETFGDEFKDIADNCNNFFHEIAKIQDEFKDIADNCNNFFHEIAKIQEEL